VSAARSGRAHRPVRGALLVLAALLAVLVGWWTIAAPAADPAAVLAVEVDPAVQVVREDGVLALHPAAGPSSRAVILYAGARVDPAAYLATVRPLVAATGVSVYLPAFPLRLAVLAPGRADAVRAAHPEVTEWWIGGHSLGGAMAAGQAADARPGAYRGLLLLAAYPPGEGLADRDDLVVLSIVGGRDGLTTVDDVDRRRDLLPVGATIAVLDGVNHAQFGRYGTQPGDGEASVDDATATRLIAEALIAAVGTGAGD
jgi:hypothetical protein